MNAGSPSAQKKRFSRTTNGPPGGRSFASAAIVFGTSSGLAGAAGVTSWPASTRGVIPTRNASPGFCGTAAALVSPLQTG